MAFTVLVAHDSDLIREAVARLCGEAGYLVRAVATGHEALRVLDEQRPAAMVLDVALPGIFSYELLEHVRGTLLPTRTVLIASVYNRAGYKRRPTSLYGADDYVEQHHIPDLLLPKLSKLLGAPMPDGKIVDAAVLRETEPIREGGEARLRIRYGSRAEGLDRARRLARLIIADIALYHRDLHAIERDDERDARLREDLEEGRLLFELRVPRDLREGTDFIGEALSELLKARREGRLGEAISIPTGREEAKT